MRAPTRGAAHVRPPRVSAARLTSPSGLPARPAASRPQFGERPAGLWPCGRRGEPPPAPSRVAPRGERRGERRLDEYERGGPDAPFAARYGAPCGRSGGPFSSPCERFYDVLTQRPCVTSYVHDGNPSRADPPRTRIAVNRDQTSKSRECRLTERAVYRAIWARAPCIVTR